MDLQSRAAFVEAIKLPIPFLHAKNFEDMPLSSIPALVGISVLYTIGVYLGTKVFGGKKPVPGLIILSTIWNLIMTTFSAYCYIGVFLVFLNNFEKNGWSLFSLVCDPTHFNYQDTLYWFYIFYVSKYFEYMDTLLLILKGKRMIPAENETYLLHVYHHIVTASIAYVVMAFQYSACYYGVMANAFVHIWMYLYYFFAELNLVNRKWGGVFITPIQIIQFIFGFVLGSYDMFHLDECNSSRFAIYYSLANFMVFLVAFWRIFSRKSKERSGKPKAE